MKNRIIKKDTRVRILSSGKEGIVRSLIPMNDGVTVVVKTRKRLIACPIGDLQLLPNQSFVSKSTPDGSTVCYRDRVYKLLNVYCERGRIVCAIKEQKGQILSGIPVTEVWRLHHVLQSDAQD